MNFVQVWLTGYVNPGRLVEELKGRPAPHWGIYGQGLRALLDGLLLYLPLAVLGRAPSTPSFLTFVPIGRYYAWSIIMTPLFLLLEWLLLAALVHVILRLAVYRSDIDQILNITGMAALVVGAFLLVWDWGYVLLGGRSDIFLGTSHLVFAIWAIVITVLGFKRILGVPVWLGLLLNAICLVTAVPLNIIFVRGPV